MLDSLIVSSRFGDGKRYVTFLLISFGDCIYWLLQTKKKKKSKKAEAASASAAAQDSKPSATTTATPAANTSGAVKRDLAAKVEEVEE